MSFAYVLKERNVLGGPLEAFSFYSKSGYCNCGFCLSNDDSSIDIPNVCSFMSEDFLSFSGSCSDFCFYDFRILLSTVSTGDWCCVPVLVWKKAFDAGVAPLVNLSATHDTVLRWITFNEIVSKRYAIWNDKPTQKSATAT